MLLPYMVSRAMAVGNPNFVIAGDRITDTDLS
jgi:hypothetical protein